MGTEWIKGTRRLGVELICCSACGSTDVYRRGSKESQGHWRCRSCSHHWTETLTVGRGKASNAKIPAAELDYGLWTTGQRRRQAEVVCCPDCGCTKVRCSSARTYIAYWYCSSCGSGWNEPASVARDKACRVKLASPALAEVAAAIAA